MVAETLFHPDHVLLPRRAITETVLTRAGLDELREMRQRADLFVVDAARLPFDRFVLPNLQMRLQAMSKRVSDEIRRRLLRAAFCLRVAAFGISPDHALLFCRVHAQQDLAFLFCALSWSDQTRLRADVREILDISPDAWLPNMAGASAVARCAAAVQAHDCEAYLPRISEDALCAIDLLVRHRDVQLGTGFCVQVKSRRYVHGVHFSTIVREPCSRGTREEEVAWRVWQGTRQFNRTYRVGWTPALSYVGPGDGSSVPALTFNG